MFAMEYAVIENSKSNNVRYRKKMITGQNNPDAEENDDPDMNEVCLVGSDLTEFNVRRIGPGLRKLDLSFNMLQRLTGLDISGDTLEEVIVDNNQLHRMELRGSFPNLHTLSINKNRISDLMTLVATLKRATPGLTYLSLLGNPACPDQLSADVNESDYQEYRYFIIHHLPALRSLDHKPVTRREFYESQRSHHGEVKFYQESSPLPSQRSGKPVGRVQNATSKGKQGKRRIKYVGKNSEGNRFIRDKDL